MLGPMKLPYLINFIGHDVWLESEFKPDLASGDVITRDGEVLGVWRVVDYNPEDDDAGGRYEFVLSGQDVAIFTQEFSHLDDRFSRGIALSRLTRAISEWYENQSAL